MAVRRKKKDSRLARAKVSGYNKPKRTPGHAKKSHIVVAKVGTKVKNIRLVDGDHDIDCKIDGIGAMKLKSQFVKKV